MSIDFSCPACGKAYRLKEELAGKSARCKCGQQLKIPTPARPADDELSDLLEEIQEPPEKKTPPPTALDTASAGTQKSKVSAPGHRLLSPFGTWLEITGSSVVKILIGALVGAFIGLWSIAQDKGARPLGLSMKIATICGAAIAGVAAATILVIADMVRTRTKEAHRVPALLRWYFASRWLSLVLWIITIIAATFVAVILFV